MSYTQPSTVTEKREQVQQPHKVRCAYTAAGFHYFIKDMGNGPFCSRACAKRDERDGPG